MGRKAHNLRRPRNATSRVAVAGTTHQGEAIRSCRVSQQVAGHLAGVVHGERSAAGRSRASRSRSVSVSSACNRAIRAEGARQPPLPSDHGAQHFTGTDRACSLMTTAKSWPRSIESTSFVLEDASQPKRPTRRLYRQAAGDPVSGQSWAKKHHARSPRLDVRLVPC